MKLTKNNLKSTWYHIRYKALSQTRNIIHEQVHADFYNQVWVQIWNPTRNQVREIHDQALNRYEIK